MSQGIVRDLHEMDFRLTRAVSLIEHVADQRSRVGRSPEDLVEVEHLRAKASGLRLALSYLREQTGTRPVAHAATGLEFVATVPGPRVAARTQAPLADPTGRSASSTDFRTPTP